MNNYHRSILCIANGLECEMMTTMMLMMMSVRIGMRTIAPLGLRLAERPRSLPGKSGEPAAPARERERERERAERERERQRERERERQRERERKRKRKRERERGRDRELVRKHLCVTVGDHGLARPAEDQLGSAPRVSVPATPHRGAPHGLQKAHHEHARSRGERSGEHARKTKGVAPHERERPQDKQNKNGESAPRRQNNGEHPASERAQNNWEAPRRLAHPQKGNKGTRRRVARKHFP